VTARSFFPRRMVGAAAASVLVALGLTLTLGAAGAWADGTDGIAGAPSADGGVDQSRSRFTYQVEPGQVINDEYLVENTGTTVQSVTVYATDAFNADDGQYSLMAGDQTATDAGHWVTFAQGADRVQATLAPGASEVIPFTVTAPADARPGDHAGGLIVSALSPAGQVSVDRRVAVRLYVRVKGLLQPALTISSIESSYAPDLNPFSGATTLTVSLTNTGNVSLGANTVAQVRGLFGIPLSGLTDQKIPEMLPGSSRTVSFVVPGVGAWVFLNPHISLTATVDPDALNAGALPFAERDDTVFVVPWALLILFVVAAAIWILVRLGRQRDSTKARIWIEYTEAEARRKAHENAVVTADASAV